MASLEIFPSLPFGSNESLTFDFNNLLAFGEVITGITTTSIVFAGIDPVPGNILNGLPTNGGTSVTQNVWRGISGVIYTLVCVATTSLGHVLTREGRLAIITPGGKFGS